MGLKIFLQTFSVKYDVEQLMKITLLSDKFPLLVIMAVWHTEVRTMDTPRDNITNMVSLLHMTFSQSEPIIVLAQKFKFMAALLMVNCNQ